MRCERVHMHDETCSFLIDKKKSMEEVRYKPEGIHSHLAIVECCPHNIHNFVQEVERYNYIVYKREWGTIPSIFLRMKRIIHFYEQI
jgi:hypothetical protein